MMVACPTCGNSYGLAIAGKTIECLECQSLRWKHLGGVHSPLSAWTPGAAAALGAAPRNDAIIQGTTAGPDGSDSESQFSAFAELLDRDMNLMHFERENQIFFSEVGNREGKRPSKFEQLQKALTTYQNWIARYAAYPARIEEFAGSIQVRSNQRFLVLLDEIESFLIGYQDDLAAESREKRKQDDELQYADLALELDRQLLFMRMEITSRRGQLGWEEESRRKIAVYQKWIDIFSAYPGRIDGFPAGITRQSFSKLTDVLAELDAGLTELEDGLKARTIFSEIPAAPSAQPPRSLAESLKSGLPPFSFISLPNDTQAKAAPRQGVAAADPDSAPVGAMPHGRVFGTPETSIRSDIDLNRQKMQLEFNGIYARWKTSYFDYGLPVPAEEFSWSMARHEHWIAQFEPIKRQIADLPDGNAFKAGLAKDVQAILDDLNAAKNINRQAIDSIQAEQLKRYQIQNDAALVGFKAQTEVIQKWKDTFAQSNANWSRSFRG